MQPTRALQALRYRRLRLTTKDVNKGFYKGTGTGSMGRHTKYGGYIIEWDKVRTYVCPPLDGFKVRQTSSSLLLALCGKQEAGADEGEPIPAHAVRDAQHATDVWPVRWEQAGTEGSCHVSGEVEV